MALDTRTRSSISEGDQLLTTSFLRAELASMETRLTLRMGAMGVVILSALLGLKLFA